MAKKPTSDSKSSKDAPRMISDNTKLSLTVPWDTFITEYNKVLARSAKQVKLPGFRKGKAPKKVAESELNREQLIDKTLQSVIPPLYEKMIKREGKQPLTNPEFNPVSMEWEKDWQFEVFIAEKPEVALGDYKKIIKNANKQAAEEIKRVEKEHEEIHKTEQHHHTEDEIKSRDREIKLHVIFRELVQAIKPQVPELLLKEETRRALQDLVQELDRMKLTLDNYLERRKQTFEELSNGLAAQTLGQLQLGLILEAMEKAEKITVDTIEVEEELKAVKDEKLRTQMKANPRYIEYIQTQVRRRKLLDWMITVW